LQIQIAVKRQKLIFLHTILFTCFVCFYQLDSIVLKIIFAALVLCIIAVAYVNAKQLDVLFAKYYNSEQLLSEIFKAAPDLIFHKDCDLKYISCNDAFVTAMCLSKTEIIGKTDFDMLEKNLAEEVAIYDRQVIATREAVVYDQKIVSQNGEIKIYNLIKSPLFSSNGDLTGVLGIARDVTVQKELQKAFNQKQSQLSAILENMPFFAYMKDAKGNFVCGNQKVTEFFGKRPEDLLNLPVANMFLDDITGILQEDAQIIQSKKPLRNERKLSTIKGEMWMEINKAPIFDEEGNVSGIVVVSKDINCQKMIETQKENFVATLTHDLKTPAMAQIRALDVILKGALGEINEEQKDAIAQVRNSCSYIFEMISTLLTTYKYEDGIKKMNYEKFHFESLVSECFNEIASLLEEKKQKVIIKNEALIHHLNADKLELKRVITNLISNAISYSEKNSEIEVSIGGDNDNVSFSVRNKSEFIPPNELDKLFCKFVSNASKFKKIGFGLGLYLTKQIVNAHNGEVFAKSCQVDGNTFGFKIPVNINLAQECVESLENNN